MNIIILTILLVTITIAHFDAITLILYLHALDRIQIGVVNTHSQLRVEEGDATKIPGNNEAISLDSQCASCDKLSKTHTFTKKFAPLRSRKKTSDLTGIVDESNHDGSEQESFSEQERFVQAEIIFTLRKEAIRPVVWAVGRFPWSGRLAAGQRKNLVV